jgi:hypothetical protein
MCIVAFLYGGAVRVQGHGCMSAPCSSVGSKQGYGTGPGIEPRRINTDNIDVGLSWIIK